MALFFDVLTVVSIAWKSPGQKKQKEVPMTTRTIPTTPRITDLIVQGLMMGSVIYVLPRI